MSNKTIAVKSLSSFQLSAPLQPKLRIVAKALCISL